MSLTNIGMQRPVILRPESKRMMGPAVDPPVEIPTQEPKPEAQPIEQPKAAKKGKPE